MPWECKQSDEELVEAVRRLAAERGGTLKVFEFCDAVGVSPATINRRFGGWMKLRERVGLAAARSFTSAPVAERRERLIELLKRAVKDAGAELSLAEFCEHARVSSQTVQGLFGGWRQLRKAAGLKPRTPASQLTPLHLLQELQRVHQKLEVFPTLEQLEREGRYPSRLYTQCFPSARELMRQYVRFLNGCGLPPLVVPVVMRVSVG
jgi:hypothetical protein